MSRNHKIKYTPAAVDDMDEIFSYISQDNIVAAEILLGRIDNKVSKLADFPNVGTVLSDEEYKIIKRCYRFMVIHPYLVFYRVIDDVVIIHRILHSRRDYLRELFD